MVLIADNKADNPATGKQINCVSQQSKRFKKSNHEKA